MTDEDVTTVDDLGPEPVVQLFQRPSTAVVLTSLTDAAGTALRPSDILDDAQRTLGDDAPTRKTIYNTVEELLDRYEFVEDASDEDEPLAVRVDLSADVVQGFIQLRDALIDGPGTVDDDLARPEE